MWNDFIVAVENRIRPTPPRRNPWQKHEAFISGAAAHMRDISKAWRNPLVHQIALSYDKQDARDIFQSVASFMRHLATKLDESRKGIH